jgi:Domain of unknown function (DUF5668)
MAADARLIHAVRGPITLITLGVLFTLDHFTSYGFNQTWPVLLIVFGLLSLMRRNASQHASPGSPPWGGAPGTPPWGGPPGTPPWGGPPGTPPWGGPPGTPPWAKPPEPPSGASFGSGGGYRQSSYGTTAPPSGTVTGQSEHEGGSR